MKKIILIITFFLAFTVNAQPLSNQLKNHDSPYLAMHGNDPVAWQQWNEQTVKRAQRENKLLFVSSGYFSCHWCHVMQRESFSNQQIASLLNKYFIPVKVDRELNASLDSRLIDFVEKTRGYAGWPLNVFITPDGYPLAGMVYLPSNDFTSLLTNMRGEWAAHSAELETLARQASRELTRQAPHKPTTLNKQFVESLTADFVTQALSQADEMQGGFGEQSKFPLVPQLDVLMDIYNEKHDQRLGEFLQLTLDMMASQGLRDQLGGGFFRYTVDPGWQVPHFEKMLNDNAQLASLYLKAAKVFQRSDYESIGRETLDFMLAEMRDSSGAFIASLSAIDNNNVEGGYYLWTPQQLEEILDKNERGVISEIWQIKGPEDIEGGHHLVTASSLEQLAIKFDKPVAQIKQLYRQARVKMLTARQQRQLPVDRKKIAAWNGLALSALVAGARLKMGYQRYEAAAHQLRSYLVMNFWKNNHLYRAVNNKLFGDAGLEDAAYLLKGLLDYQQYLGSESDTQKALLDSSWKLFYQQQGWQLNAMPLLKYRQYAMLVADGSMPSPAALFLESSLRLADKYHDRQLSNKIKQHLSLVAKPVAQQVFWHASYLRVYSHLGLYRQLD